MVSESKDILYKQTGPVAQLVRASSLYLESRWFESIQAHHLYSFNVTERNMLRMSQLRL